MTEQNISKTINNSSIVQSDLKNKINKRKQYDHSFKIVLIGDSGVGKSCILLRFADDKFNDNFYTTVGVDFRFKSVDINDKTIKYEIVSVFYYINNISGILLVKKDLKLLHLLTIEVLIVLLLYMM